MEQRQNEEHIFRFFLYILSGGEESDPFRAVLYENPSRLITVLQQSVKSLQNSLLPATTESNSSSSPMLMIGAQQSPQQVPAPASTIDVTSSPTPMGVNSSSNLIAYQRYQIVRIVSILIKHDSNWLTNQTELIKSLKAIWLSNSFHVDHKENYQMDTKHWEEPRLLVKCLLNYLDHNQQDIELYFQLLRAFIGKYHCDFEFLRSFFADEMPKNFSIEWKRNAFLKFCDLFNSNQTKCTISDCTMEWSEELKAKILQYIIIPIFSYTFKNGENEKFLGPPLKDDSTANNQDSNLVSVFIDVLMKETTVIDSIAILVLQLGCLIVEHASNYIRPAQISENERVPRSKREKAEVRRLMSYAWPGINASKRQDS
ncbi:hypothetical protein BLA29_004623, partial [Euroglyphus maynei]